MIYDSIRPFYISHVIDFILVIEFEISESSLSMGYLVMRVVRMDWNGWYGRNVNRI